MKHLQNELATDSCLIISHDRENFDYKFLSESVSGELSSILIHEIARYALHLFLSSLSATCSFPTLVPVLNLFTEFSRGRYPSLSEQRGNGGTLQI